MLSLALQQIGGDVRQDQHAGQRSLHSFQSDPGEGDSKMINDYRRGDYVLLNFTNGPSRRLVVWGLGKNVIYLCGEKDFRLLDAGSTEIVPIGCPREDVVSV